jgi:aminodeoxyfutalosine synthase
LSAACIPICRSSITSTLIRGLKERFPQVHLKAFTMVEVGYYARISKLSIRDTLLAMKNAGVDSLPGGGAEIFHPRVRKIICDHKVSGQRGWKSRAPRTSWGCARTRRCCTATSKRRKSAWIICCSCARRRTSRTASSPSFRWRFILRIRGSGASPGPTGMDDLKAIAVSRLLLDNFDHIKAYWIMLTPRIAQVALRFGANDLDGTVVEEKIYHDAGATTPEFMTRAELERLIRAAGRVPVERDTLYNPVDRVKNPMPPV